MHFNFHRLTRIELLLDPGSDIHFIKIDLIVDETEKILIRGDVRF